MPQIRHYTVRAEIEFKIGGAPLTYGEAIARAEERLKLATSADGSPMRPIHDAKITSITVEEDI